jgi:CRP-like cAMP-binding protein
MPGEAPHAAHAVGALSCSRDERLHALHRVPFFAMLGHDEIAAINASFRAEGYDRAETIYSAGAPATALYVVATGRVRVTRHTLEGQDVVLDILAPGEFFGGLALIGSAEYPDTAVAWAPCCVLATGPAELQRIFLAHPPAAVAALEAMGARLQTAHETIRRLSALPVEARIAAVLLALGSKLGEDDPRGRMVRGPALREDMAAMVGATVETVSRVLKVMRTSGIVDTAHGWILILDPAALEDLATG